MKKPSNNRKAANKRIFEILNEFGDDGETKREVTHWFYFKAFENLERFEKYAYEIGFQTMNKDKKPEMGKFLLIIYRMEGVNEDSINFDTFDFWEKAREFNGTYDGWETSIEME